MRRHSLHESGRHDGAVRKGRHAQQTKRVDETSQPRIVADMQRGHQGREGVRPADASVVRRLRHVLAPANGNWNLT